MKLQVDQLIHPSQITVEIDGVPLHYLVSIDTETGEAKQYKHVEGCPVYTAESDEIVLETVFYPVEKLHIYLVKPE